LCRKGGLPILNGAVGHVSGGVTLESSEGKTVLSGMRRKKATERKGGLMILTKQ